MLAYFGYPKAHEDAAERAVRAGLAVVGAVARLTAPGGTPLAARVGIATGLVVVGELIGEGAAREQAVVGETPNLAARLQDLGEPGGVVIGRRTRQLVGGLFELADLGGHRVKGFARPVQAWRVVGEGAAESRFDALHVTGLTPLVGREHELGLLLDRWQLAKDGEGQVVLLSGEPGIGKSRLVRALRERLGDEPYTSLSHYCSPFHQTSALYPVIGLLERAAGFARDDPPERKLDKLEATLALSTDEVREVAPLLAALLAIPTGDRYPPLDLTPERQKEKTLAALADQLAGLAARQPALALYEDVHWSDPTTLELLELVVDRVEGLPVLALITFRPEFTPPWGGHAHVTALTLNRLGRRQGGAMVERVTGGKALPAEVAEQIVAKTDGVPLFVEELTKTVPESGLLTDAGDRYELAGPLPPLAIPATLHDSLMARLDRSAPVKEVAQLGAAIGREFSHELLAAVAPLGDNGLKDALDQLVRSGLVFRRGTPPEATYSFKHALVQDAAYQSLLKSKRQQLHARVAQALEARFPEAIRRQPELLAHHLTQAGLLERAVDAWAQAGRTALLRSAMREAATHFDQAIELVTQLPSTVERKRREMALSGQLSVALGSTLGLASQDAERAQLRALELAAEIGDTEDRFRAQWGRWRVYNGRARLDRALQLAEELHVLAGRLKGSEYALQALHALWSTSLLRGEFCRTLEVVQQGRSLYQPEHHGPLAFAYGGHDAGECCLSLGGNALWFLGHPEQAQRWHEEALALAMRLGHPQIICHAYNWTAVRLQLAGEVEALRAHVEVMSRLAREHAFANWYPEAKILEGWIAATRDRDRHALALIREGLGERTATGTLFAQTYLMAVLADACLATGEAAEAQAVAGKALTQVRLTGEHLCEAELHRLRGRALLAQDRGRVPEAEAALLDALRAARARSARTSELRTATSLAQLWAERGRRTEARDLLAPIHGWFTEGLDTPDLREARALLDELASAPHGSRARPQRRPAAPVNNPG